MMSLRSARFSFLLSKGKPTSFINLHRVVFKKFSKSLSLLTAFRTLSSVGISLLAYMLCTFRRMAWIVKLSCLMVGEREILTSRGLFFGDGKGPRSCSALNSATVWRDTPVFSLAAHSTSQTDFSGKRNLVRAHTFAMTYLAFLENFKVRALEKMRAREVVELDALGTILPQQAIRKEWTQLLRWPRWCAQRKLDTKKDGQT